MFGGKTRFGAAAEGLLLRILTLGSLTGLAPSLQHHVRRRKLFEGIPQLLLAFWDKIFHSILTQLNNMECKLR